MPARTRLYDIRLSDLPASVGLCAADKVGIANYVNSAQRRLLFCKEAGAESWLGTWAEIRFTVSRAAPFVTFDNTIARLELVDICDYPVTVNNQFVEYLRFGNGRMPKLFRQGHCNCFVPQVYSRNNAPTFTDITPGNFVRAYATDATDYGKRVLMQGKDNNGNIIYTQDGLSRVQGQWENLTTPFIQWPMQFNEINGIQKDITNAPVNIYGVDPTTGNQTLLVTMQPNETVAGYRRYFFSNLPFNCCTSTGPNPCISTPQTDQVVVTAIAKLEFVPVTVDTDYCLIGNLEALKCEAQAYRYSTMDSPQSKQLEQVKHRQAVGFLNGELNHALGLDDPAVNLSVFGSARLERHRIGSLL